MSHPSLFFVYFLNKQYNFYRGSGCGSVGRVVASNTRGPRFESSHRQKFIYNLNICFLSTVYWTDKIKKHRPRMAHKKQYNFYNKKCPSSIWYWDSNPPPSEHESPSITTWPDLTPKYLQLLTMQMFFEKNIVTLVMSLNH